jgi:hypothetical protein
MSHWTAAGLRIVNVTFPAVPVLAGSYDTPGSAHGVALAGQYVYVADEYGLLILSVHIQTCAVALTGDVNLSGTVTPSDIIYLVNYVLKAGATPLPCRAAGDVNCDGAIIEPLRVLWHKGPGGIETRS